jgi:hypothetical protein
MSTVKLIDHMIKKGFDLKRNPYAAIGWLVFMGIQIVEI